MTTRPLSPLTMLLSRHTRRREFITLLGGAAAAWPLAARAQETGKVARIGFLGPSIFNDPSSMFIPLYQALLAQLRVLGFNEGQNLVVTYGAVDDARGLPAVAAELTRSQPKLIVVSGTEAMLQSVLAANRAIPIVLIAVNFDPIARGYVNSLARPGGNITGVVFQQLELAEKQVELLTQTFPGKTRLAALYDCADCRPVQRCRAERKIPETADSGAEARKSTVRFRCSVPKRGGGRGANGARPVQPAFHSPSGPDRRTGESASSAHHVPVPAIRRQWRPHVLRRRLPSHVSPRCRLRCPGTQRYQARRSTGGASVEVRACDQPQGGQGDRHRVSDWNSGARRRGDRMIGRREFITLLGGAATWPMAARAQQ